MGIQGIRGIDGLPIVDATKPLALLIDDKDVKGANVKEPAECVVARACRNHLHAIEVRVHLSRIYIRFNKGNWQRFLTPKAMRDEIIAFDRGGRFQTGTFALAPPNPNARLTGKRTGGKKDRFSHASKNPNRKSRRAPNILKDVRTGPFSGD